MTKMEGCDWTNWRSRQLQEGLDPALHDPPRGPPGGQSGARKVQEDGGVQEEGLGEG